MDLDDLGIPNEPDVCHARPYDSTIARNKIPTVFNSKSSLGTEEDITDERPHDFVDVSWLSGVAVRVECNDDEGSVFAK